MGIFLINVTDELRYQLSQNIASDFDSLRLSRDWEPDLDRGETSRFSPNLAIIDFDQFPRVDLGFIESLRSSLKQRALPVLILYRHSLPALFFDIDHCESFCLSSDKRELYSRIRFIQAMQEQLKSSIKRETELHEISGLLKALNKEWERLSYSDTLTSLANRRFFNERYEEEWKRAKRDKYCLSLILADVDHFKAYNDRFGHSQGDECLQQIAEQLRSSLRRPADLVARYGGEEFMILLPQTNEAGAEVVGQGILTGLRQLALPSAVDGELVSLSLGIAGTDCFSSCSATELIDKADAGLYQAKAEGRDRLVRASEKEFQLPHSEFKSGSLQKRI